MNTVFWIALGWAAVLAALGIFCIVRQDAGERFRLFSRSRIAGWVLTAVTLGWGAWLLWHTPLGPFEELKPLLAVLAPVGYLLIVLCMDELLAARALGVLFIMVPAPVLDAVRWHPSACRLVIVALCYATATSGIALVLSPYLLRKFGQRLASRRGGRRVCGVAGLVLASCLLALALTVFR